MIRTLWIPKPIRVAINKAQAKATLLFCMYGYSRSEGINILLCTSYLKASQAGMPEIGQHLVGCYDSHTKVIFLTPGHFTNVWTLAHELGHHMMCAKNSRHTESDANKAAKLLVKRILDKDSYELLKKEMNAELFTSRRKT